MTLPAELQAAVPARSRARRVVWVGLGISVAGVGCAIGILVLSGVLADSLGVPTPGEPEHYEVTGSAALVLGVTMLLSILAVPVGAVVAVVGIVLSLTTWSGRVSVAHDELVHARETAHTATEVAVVQGTPVPGQRRRVAWAVAKWWVPTFVAALLAWVGLGRPALFCLAVQAVVLGARAALRWLAPRTGGDEAVAIPLPDGAVTVVGPGRSEQVRAAAVAAGWSYAATPPAGGDWVDLSTHNVCTGSVDGVSFTMNDVIAPAPSGVGHGVAVKTVVQLGFAAVFELGVVPRTESPRTGVSLIGPTVDLESSEFADRYRVYCDDPIRGRMVMNPALMAMILAFAYPLEIFIQRSMLQVSTPNALVGAPDLAGFVALAGKLHFSALSATTQVDGEPR